MSAPTPTPAPIPPEVEVVRSFANTVDVREGGDELTSPAALQRWLREAGLIPRGVPASGRDLALAVRLRKVLRAALATNHDRVPDPAAAAALDAVCRDLPLTAVSTPEGFAPTSPGVRGALTRIVAQASTARIKGTWSRLKICQAEDCGWAYYDTSRNRSRRFCSTEVCGERTKARASRS